MHTLRTAAGFAIALLVAHASPSSAEACGAPPEPTPYAIPRKGATNGIVLTGGGKTIPLGFPQSLGGGHDDVTGASGSVWRVRIATALTGSTEYVATMEGAGATIELTRFTTAAGYDKPAGTPPEVKSLALTRVRYPLKYIASGNCVFAEYHGFAVMNWTDASLPNTPADSVVHILSLAAKTGGHDQQFVWIGSKPYMGQAPFGTDLLPTSAGFAWFPYLDPTREYCLTVTAYGYGEATLPVRSNTVCASVAEVSSADAAVSSPPACNQTSRG